MLITKPAYYDAFHCLAGACPDSCCQEWDVQVDPVSAARYRALPGALGDRLREVLQDGDGETRMTIVDGRCPMWQPDGLCRIQAELGEADLCRTCREYPRLRHDYGDFVELGLELSCPEAARLILTAPHAAPVAWEVPGGETPDYDREAMAVLKATRETMRSILADPVHSVGEALALGLLYGCQAQDELDGGEPQPFDPEAALAEARSLAVPGDMGELLEFFRRLEILTPRWREQLRAPSVPVFSDLLRPMAAYLVDRYWLQAVSDYDLYCRVKLVIVSCLLVACLGGDVQTAQLFSKEIENSAENVDAILDAAYTHPAFTDARLLGLLLARC